MWYGHARSGLAWPKLNHNDDNVDYGEFRLLPNNDNLDPPFFFFLFPGSVNGWLVCFLVTSFRLTERCTAAHVRI